LWPALRDAERSRQVEAKRLEGLRERQSREWGALISGHKRESDRLLHEHQVERDHHSQYASQPAGIEARQKKERNDLDRQHAHEKDKLSRRHDAELAKAKRLPPEARVHA
jgi:hypothetical protein